MPAPDRTSLPWPGAAVDWLRTWQQVWQLAPTQLEQPILPGWTFNINSGNSSSPQTEAEVLARHSYGRQLGRMADALAALVQERHGAQPAAACYAGFLQMKAEIDRVKLDAAAARVQRLQEDLRALQAADRSAFERLRAELRTLLD